MSDWDQVQREFSFPEGSVFVIRNDQTGAYIHKTLFKIRAFRSYYGALVWIRKNGLSEDIYRVEVIR